MAKGVREETSGFKIGKPCREENIPRKCRPGSKYAPIVDAVMALPNGDWIPVECTTRSEANKIDMAMRTRLSLPRIESRVRGTTVYLRRGGEGR